MFLQHALFCHVRHRSLLSIPIELKPPLSKFNETKNAPQI